ncbi:MAG TPA: hypothetical protein VGK67_18670 [Myxococcales bacterium]|jgi:hypothetical protein
MKSLLFENDGALKLALTTGLVPEDLAASPAGVLREADGKLVVFPSESLKRAAELKLAAAGVAFVKEARAPTRQVGCWAQILLPRRTGSEPEKGPVLFVIPEDGSALSLGAEMLRLGCDRQDFCIVPGGGPALLRAIDPPYFTLASILDGSRRLQAFVPTPPGQDKVWTELGHSHPLAGALQAPEGRLLLVGGDGSWREVGDGPWTSIYSVLELQVPGAPLKHEKQPVPPTLKVRLRLAKASRNEPTALFVLRQDAVEQIDALVRGCSDELVQRLLFAATGDPKNPTIILRARPGRQAPPELQLTGEAYLPLLATGQLFIPRDASLEPPLRKEKIRDLLAPGNEEIAWLAPTEGDGFRVERIAESAFAPLSDWVEYLVHAAAPLESWVRRATFDFAFFESAGLEWADGPRRPEKEEREERGPRRERTKGPREAPEPAPAPKAAPAAARPAAPAPAEEYRLQPTGEEEQSLHALEKQFVEMDVPADHPSRSSLWSQMAALHARLGRGADAGLCWTRSFWELGAAEAGPLVDRWARGESFLATRSSDPAGALRTLLDVKAATRDQTRAMAALVALAAQGQTDLAVDPHAAQVWLDANDDNLDVRSLWLARSSLSKLVGGDRLGVARTRDRILARLHRGLSLERDVPTFLRFLGQGAQTPLGSLGRGDGAMRLVTVLGDLLDRFERTERKRSPVEAPPLLTRAYVLFVFAYGFARLGAADRARSLRSTASGLLPAGEPVHGFLSRSFGARVDCALEGLPVETPLPPPIQAELNKLEKFLRYKVDRLRQASTVLEPQERLDPVQAFQRGDQDPRGEEFATLRGMTDPGRLGVELEKLLKVALAQETRPEDSARLFDGIMDFFPMLPDSQALPRLQSLLGGMDDIQAVRRISLLEEALMLAGYFGRAELVRQIVATIEKLLGGLTPESANEVGGIIGRCLRSLRRVGLRNEAAHLLDAVAAIVTGTGPKALSARLNLASGQAYLGRLDQAMPEFDRAQRALQAKDLQMPDRLALTRACAGALSQTPQEYAAAGIMRLAEQLKGITDSFNTNSHFCLSVVGFMESLVLGLASEDLALGEFGRRWLDEEEYLVRRRIQRENAEAAG